MDVPVPFPIPNPDACTSGALKCPILPNVQSSYLTELAVLKSYPRVKVDVKWQLQSEKGVDIVCILIPVKIQ